MRNSEALPGWLLVANPLSGRGRGPAVATAFADLLRSRGQHAEVVITQAPMHAAALAADAVRRGCHRIAAVGGDGTTNEVLNGMADQTHAPLSDLTLATVPVGTGNDWARSLRLPSSHARLADLFARDEAIVCDLGRVTCQGPHGESVRWFSNVAGAGFDAFVVERLTGRKHSRWSYLVELLQSARHFQAPQLCMETVDGRVTRRSLAVFAGLGRYCGGGMEVAPDALLDDGHADVTLVHDMSLWQLIGELRRLFDRSVPRSAHVTTQRAAWLSIESPSAVSVQADGELVGRLPARIDVHPRAIRVIAPATKDSEPGNRTTPGA